MVNYLLKSFNHHSSLFINHFILDPYFREWHKRNSENVNKQLDSEEFDAADVPPPQGVAADPKKVYSEEPISQKEREEVEKSITKEDDNENESINNNVSNDQGKVLSAIPEPVSQTPQSEDLPSQSNQNVKEDNQQLSKEVDEKIEDPSTDNVNEPVQQPSQQPQQQVTSKTNPPALPKGVANLKNDINQRKPEGISTPAGEHVPIYPGDTPDTPDITGKPNPVTYTVPLENVQLTETKEDEQIPVMEEGGTEHKYKNAEDESVNDKKDEIVEDQKESTIENKKENLNVSDKKDNDNWTTLPAPEEVPTPMRLSQRSPDTPLAPSLQPSPHESEENVSEKKPEEDKQNVLPPKTPEKAKFSDNYNNHLSTPQQNELPPRMSPGNASIASGTQNLPGGYAQTPEKAQKELDEQNQNQHSQNQQQEQEQPSTKRGCLIS